MIGNIFNTILYRPLYNGLIFLMGYLPWLDAGFIVVLFTILVRIAMFPLSKKAVITQLQMKHVEGDLAQIKEKYKNDKQEQSRKMMALYKEKKINPFSSILLLFIQLPIIWALYKIFFSGLSSVNPNLLYGFLSGFADLHINMHFLGLIDISSKSAILAFLAAITTYFQIKYSMPPIKKTSGVQGFKEDLAKSMQLQMKYVFPVIVFFISYGISGVVALYWTTSNLFTIAQEIYIRKKFAKSDFGGKLASIQKNGAPAK